MVSTYFDNNQTLVRAILIYQFHCCFAVWFMFCCFSFAGWLSLAVLIVCKHSACFPSVVNFFLSHSLSSILLFEWPYIREHFCSKSLSMFALAVMLITNVHFDCCFTNGGQWVEIWTIIEILWHVHNSIHGISMYVYMFVTTAIRCNVTPIPIQSLSIWSVRMPAWRLGICFIIFTLWMNGWMQCTQCFFVLPILRHIYRWFFFFFSAGFFPFTFYLHFARNWCPYWYDCGRHCSPKIQKVNSFANIILFRFVSFRFKPDTKGHKSNINYFLIDIDTSTFGEYECVSVSVCERGGRSEPERWRSTFLFYSSLQNR